MCLILIHVNCYGFLHGILVCDSYRDIFIYSTSRLSQLHVYRFLFIIIKKPIRKSWSSLYMYVSSFSIIWIHEYELKCWSNEANWFYTVIFGHTFWISKTNDSSEEDKTHPSLGGRQYPIFFTFLHIWINFHIFLGTNPKSNPTPLAHNFLSKVYGTET